jgi:hypothetical protein
MQHKLLRFHVHAFRWRYIWSEEFLALLLAVFVFVTPVMAATRLQQRGVYMNSSVPGATTFYTVSFRYVGPDPVGSVDMLFCIDPIPDDPCVTPPGLDVSNAVLSNQTGETGFSITQQSTNHILLSRVPNAVISPASSYKFDNIVNPTDTNKAFSIRLRTHGSTDATGPLINFGSVRGQVTNGIVIETQVPPMLVFCLAQEVNLGCTNTNETYYTDMGELESQSTLVARSQMAVGTNATGGFAITANGLPLAAGTSVINGPATPTASQPGTNQFGINLVANNDPAIGEDPEGTWANALPSPDYAVPNQFKYVSGDVVASSPNVSLMKKFTVSYIANVNDSLRAGVYSTTITYIASGRF